jgi:hypothetical protein
MLMLEQMLQVLLEIILRNYHKDTEDFYLI